MAKRTFKNRLNDLDPKRWLKFQKSWFLHNPPPRSKDVLRHPAKFPETLVQEFVEFFTKRGQVVLDPMAGTGSALVAALRLGRHSYGIELNPEYAEIGRQIIEEERNNLSSTFRDVTSLMITGDAKDISDIAASKHIPQIDYVITSPPYWNMLRERGAETQKKRGQDTNLDMYYSDDPNDLGNIDDYGAFLESLLEIYKSIKPLLRPGAYLTVIAKNIKKGGKIFPLAWDLGKCMGDIYTLKDEKIWVQDNIRLAPYGLGNAWVSNTFHHYCLQFRNE